MKSEVQNESRLSATSEKFVMMESMFGLRRLMEVRCRFPSRVRHWTLLRTREGCDFSATALPLYSKLFCRAWVVMRQRSDGNQSTNEKHSNRGITRSGDLERRIHEESHHGWTASIGISHVNPDFHALKRQKAA